MRGRSSGAMPIPVSVTESTPSCTAIVIVPAGVWHKGAAKLKSNMTLFLAPGATLAAPQTIDQHIHSDLRRDVQINNCFLYAADAENLTIAGSGVIDGEGYHFWPNYNGEHDFSYERDDTGFFKYKRYKSVFPRPSLMIFYRCKNLQIKDVTLRNSAAYTLWPVDCDEVRIDAINIKNIVRGPNSDGIDIDCCRNVWVTNCNIYTGDDAIALKSDLRLIEGDKPCENIHISGNTLSTVACGIRLGFEGDGVIRDVVMTDNIIRVANVGIFLHSPLLPEWDLHGTKIENIVAANFTMHDVRMGFCIWHFPAEGSSFDDLQGYVRNVNFSNMIIDAIDYSYIGGKKVEGIRLDNIQMNITRFPEVAYRGQTPLQPPQYPTIWGRGFLPSPITVYPGAEVSLNNVKIIENQNK